MAPARDANGEGRRFGRWEIRPGSRVLLQDGVPVRIGSRAFDVLWALVERGGRVVGKAELLDAAWPGLVVEENNLSVQISALRKLLGAALIVNVSGIGYKLAADPLWPAVAPPGSPPAAAESEPPGNVGLVGREADLAKLAPLLGSVPLLSIVGTGGVGKTALARALVAGCRRDFADGLHWIDLTTLTAGAPLLPLLARTLGVLTDDEGLTSGDVLRPLGKEQALVVLDNCEHVLQAVADLLVPLLQAAPGLRWLATSQQPLGLAGETVHRLAPLQLPASDAEASQALRCSAMALFVQRAQSPELDLEHDRQALALAVDICRGLDGLPLALEIAAARVSTLGLQGVHEQLSRRLTLRHGQRDAPRRHHSLRETYEWSYALLEEHEKRVFRWMQPFQGGFTLAMADRMVRIGSDDSPAPEAPPTADTLAMLLDKSLVHRMPVRTAGAAARFRLLESARDFAALQLEAAGEAEAASRRHALAVATGCERAWDELQTMRDADWRRRYMDERGNVAAALLWACRHDDADLLAQLVTACALIDRFLDSDADLVQVAVPIQRLRLAAPRLRARACVELGWAECLGGSQELAIELLEQAVRDSEAVDDPACTHLSLIRLMRLYKAREALRPAAAELWKRLQRLNLARVPLRLQLYGRSTVARDFDPASSVEELRQLGRLAAEAGFELHAAICHTNETDELLIQGRYEAVVEVSQGLLAGQQDQLRMRSFISFNMAHALVRLGRFDEAAQASRSVLRATPSRAHTVLDLAAMAAAMQARWRDCALMAGCSERIKKERSWIADPAEALLIAETYRQLEQAIGTPERQRLFAFGAAMKEAEVLALAGLL